MMRRSLKIAVSAIVTVSLSLGVGSVAAADEVPSDTIEEVIDAAPDAEQALKFPEVSVDSTVSLPTESAEAITFSHEDGASLSVGLPSNADFVVDTSAELGDKTVVTAQYMTADDASRPAGLPSARAVLVIPNADAPSTYDFDIQVPEGTEAEYRTDGGITLVRPAATQQGEPQADTVIADINAPWAVDANGIEIPTSYSFDGATLTQTIDLSAVTAFPVVADPKVDWMGYFVRLTYSKAETRNMRDQGIIIGAIVGAGATIAAAAGPAAPAIIAAVYAASTVAVGVIAATASNAVGDGKCLQLDIPSMYPSIVKCRS